jgi:hypothetical protein
MKTVTGEALVLASLSAVGIVYSFGRVGFASLTLVVDKLRHGTG